MQFCQLTKPHLSVQEQQEKSPSPVSSDSLMSGWTRRGKKRRFPRWRRRVTLNTKLWFSEITKHTVLTSQRRHGDASLQSQIHLFNPNTKLHPSKRPPYPRHPKLSVKQQPAPFSAEANTPSCLVLSPFLHLSRGTGHGPKLGCAHTISFAASSPQPRGQNEFCKH